LKIKYKYYKGFLRCQFVTVDHQKLGATNYKQSKFKLEPRFRMVHVEVIEASDFPEETQLLGKPYIHATEKCNVEMSFQLDEHSQQKSEVVKISEIVLFLQNENEGLFPLDQKTEGGKFPIDAFLEEKDGVETYYSSFNAMLANPTHGKIKGIAFCKETIYLSDDDVPLLPDDVIEKNKIKKIKEISSTGIGKLANASGCFPFLFGKRITQLSGMNLGPNSNAGCFGGKDNANNNGGATGSWRGCFGSANNSGCLSSGCMMPLLLLLLAGLLYWLLNQSSCNKQTVAPIIIHDTVKVEVIKDRVDTLTIIKSDTLSYVDSTTRLNYETVSLPNVQFYTNSDTLVPSSANDLQQLAEYLIKNDSLSATIYGHTDNVGNPASNLQLSQRRAESVKRFLTSLGVQESRLKAIGMGDKEPKGDNNKLEGRLMNRRVEVKLMQTEFVSTKRSKKNNKDPKK
jgi:outer membrane protein OmpA-like peptidoglycan-associated protein